MSTTIPVGLEIRRLCWKDDSFRQADHEAGLLYGGLPAGMLGWWDNTVDNAITFSNKIDFSAFTNPDDVIRGGVTTYGVFNLYPYYSSVISNGDEVYLPAAIPIVQIEKDFPVGIPADSISSIRLRAKTPTQLSSTISITLLDKTFSTIVTKTVALTSDLYTHYTVPTYVGSDVWGIQLQSNYGAIVDYVALACDVYVNQGGASLNVTIPKKTDSQTVPNSYDIIQQLGISSRSKAVIIPKTTASTYLWFDTAEMAPYILEVVSPTQQATGYLSDVKRHTEAGWVGKPIPTSDAIGVTATGQQLYDITFSLIKADNEQNIDITCPAVTPPPLPIPVTTGPIGTTTDSDAFHDSYTRKSFYAAGQWWVCWGISSSNPYGLEESSSYNQTNWSAQVDLDSGQSPAIGYGLGVWYDPATNTFRYISAGGSPYSTNARYRVGTPTVPGTFAWLAAEQITPFNAAFGGPYTIITDNTGHDWVSDSGGGHVYRNAHTDGTWLTGLTHSVSVNNRSTIVPLAYTGGVAIVYTATASHKVYVQAYNGSTWLTAVGPTTHNIDASSGGVAGYSAVTIGTNVHIAGVDSAGDVWYVMYDSLANTLVDERVLVPTVSINARPMVSKDSAGAVYVFYPVPASNTLKYLRRWIDGTWSAIQTFVPAVGTFPGDERFASTWDDSGGAILVVYLTNHPSTWSVWGAFLPIV
jgi:hypothetical protein